MKKLNTFELSILITGIDVSGYDKYAKAKIKVVAETLKQARELFEYFYEDTSKYQVLVRESHLILNDLDINNFKEYLSENNLNRD